MPNWCVQNWILRGPKEDVQRFCDKVNSCLTRPGRPNGFGKFWLGNLCECFGYDYDELEKNSVPGLRGVFCPDPEECACLSCPEAEEVSIHPEDFNEIFSQVAFSIAHAWGPSDWFQIMVDNQFPKLMQAWHATDEFGNFHSCRNGDIFGLKRYQVIAWGGSAEERNFDEGEEDKVADFIKSCTNNTIVFSPEEIKDCQDFWDKLNEWNEENDVDYIEFNFWEEE